jgi:uncharacterized membrane protein YbhN (UPF0104 family)
MLLQRMNLVPRLNTRVLIAGALGFALLAVLVARPELLGERVGEAIAGLAAASPGWLWLAGASFLALIVCTASAWRAGLEACDACVDIVDASARYGVGSLVNSLAPAGTGGAVRIALFSRRLEHGERLLTADRVLTATGIATAIGIARAPALALLVLGAWLAAGFPLWPILLLAVITAAAVFCAVLMRRRVPRAHIAHLFDVFRALGRSPRLAASLVGWVSLATAAKLAAAGAVAAALGVESPLRAALIIVPALALANTLPLTPGNLGVGSGAIAVGLHFMGVDGPTAIATGLAFQAVESGVSLLVGSAGLVYLARLSLPAWSLRIVGAATCLALAGGFSATMLV